MTATLMVMLVSQILVYHPPSLRFYSMVHDGTVRCYYLFAEYNLSSGFSLPFLYWQ